MDTRLIKAARAGNHVLLASLLQQGANVNAITTKRRTALIIASTHGHPDCVRELIDQGAHLDHKDSHQMSAILYALQKDHVDCFRHLISHWIKRQLNLTDSEARQLEDEWVDGKDKNLLLLFVLIQNYPTERVEEAIDKGADIDTCVLQILTPVLLASVLDRPCHLQVLLRRGKRNTQKADEDNSRGPQKKHRDRVFNGKTLFMFASLSGSSRCLDILLQHFGKGDVNKGDGNKKTALMHASGMKSHDCVKLLLESGANVQRKCEEGRTALMYAASSGCLKSLELLHHYGSSVHASDFRDKTPIIFAAENGHTQCVKFLLEKGGLCHLEDRAGMSALMHAARFGRSDCVDLLLRHGAPADKMNMFTGESVLVYALESGDLDCVQLLFKDGAKVHGKSEMIHAVYGESGDCVQELLRQGYELSGKCKDTPSALFWATDHGLSHILEIFTSKITCFPPFKVLMFKAVFNGDPNTIKILLKRESSLVKERRCGKNFLMYAAVFGHLEAVKTLVEHGADIHDTCNDVKKNVLMYAAEGGNAEVCAFLLERGANGKAVDIMGRSALMFACRGGYEKAARILLQHGALINQRDYQGKTALVHAAEHGYGAAACMLVLITQGADVNCVDKEKNTPLIYSAGNGDLPAINVLLRHGADVSMVNANGSSATLASLERGHYDCFKELLTFKQRYTDADVAYKKSLIRVFILCSDQEKCHMVTAGGVFHWDWLDDVDSLQTVKEAFRALIRAGIPPNVFQRRSQNVSLLDIALIEKDEAFFKNLLTYLYFCAHDFHTLRRIQSQGDLRFVHGPMRKLNTLYNLSFLVVSNSIKCTSEFGERQRMVDTLPLPDCYKRQLNFQSPVIDLSNNCEGDEHL